MKNKLILASLVTGLFVSSSANALDRDLLSKLKSCTPTTKIVSEWGGQTAPNGEKVKVTIKGKKGGACEVQSEPVGSEFQGLKVNCFMQQETINLVTSPAYLAAMESGKATREMEKKAQKLMMRDCQVGGLEAAQKLMMQNMPAIQKQMEGVMKNMPADMKNIMKNFNVQGN